MLKYQDLCRHSLSILRNGVAEGVCINLALLNLSFNSSTPCGFSVFFTEKQGSISDLLSLQPEHEA